MNDEIEDVRVLVLVDALQKANERIEKLENEITFVEALLKIAEDQRDLANQQREDGVRRAKEDARFEVVREKEFLEHRKKGVANQARMEERTRLLAEIDGWFKAFAEIGNDRGS